MKKRTAPLKRIGAKKQNPESGFSLLGTIAVILTLGTLGAALTSQASSKAIGGTMDLQGHQAFYIAEGGMNYAIAKDFFNDNDFSNNVSPTGDPYGAGGITLGNGQFWVQYSSLSASSGTITATGRVGQSVRQMQMTATRSGSTLAALQAGGNIELEESQGGQGVIDGDIAYGGNLDNEFLISGTLTSGASAPSPVNLQPLIDLTTTTHSGNFTINGDYAGNLHVTGDLTINNSGILTGIIVADGNVVVNVMQSGSRTVNGTLAAGGNITVDFLQASVSTFTAQPAGGSIQPLLIAGGNIDIDVQQDAAATLNGLIKSGGNIELDVRQDANMQVLGSFTAGGNIDIEAKQEGSFDLDFAAGAPYLPGAGLTLQQWREL